MARKHQTVILAVVALLMVSLVALPAAAAPTERTPLEADIEDALIAELNKLRSDPAGYGGYSEPAVPRLVVKQDLTEHARTLADAHANDEIHSPWTLDDFVDVCCAEKLDNLWMRYLDNMYDHMGGSPEGIAKDWIGRSAETDYFRDIFLDPDFDHASFGARFYDGGTRSLSFHVIFRQHDGTPLPGEDTAPEEPATPEDGACPPEYVRDAGFTDVGAYRAEINCLAGWDITHGVGDGSRYNPSGSVTRAQMASFLSRAITNSGGSLPAASNDFSDVSGPHADAINRLAAAGIAGGYPDGTYRPDARITRGQMATFLTRSYEHRGDLTMDEAPPSGLSDVPGDTHEARINQAVDQGWAHGYGDGTYAPGSSVRRDHMALFITRWLDTLTAGHGVAFPD